MLIQAIDAQTKETHVVVKIEDIQEVIINQDNTGKVVVNVLSEEGELHSHNIKVTSEEATRIIKVIRQRDWRNRERLTED